MKDDETSNEGGSLFLNVPPPPKSLPPTKAKQRATPKKKEIWGVVPIRKLSAVRTMIKDLGCRLERRDNCTHLTFTSANKGDHLGTCQCEAGDENKLLMPIKVLRQRTTQAMMVHVICCTKRRHVIVEMLREFCCREPQHNFNADLPFRCEGPGCGKSFPTQVPNPPHRATLFNQTITSSFLLVLYRIFVDPPPSLPPLPRPRVFRFYPASIGPTHRFSWL